MKNRRQHGKFSSIFSCGGDASLRRYAWWMQYEKMNLLEHENF